MQLRLVFTGEHGEAVVQNISSAVLSYNNTLVTAYDSDIRIVGQWPVATLLGWEIDYEDAE